MWLEFIYSVYKDTRDYIKKKNAPIPKDVNADYIETSGLLSKWKNQGFEVAGVTPERIELKKNEGWQIMTEYDKDKKETYYLRLQKSGTIYMGKKIFIK